MVKGESVPSDDDVTRWIKPKLIGKDDDGNVVLNEYGQPAVVAPQAFSLSDDEDGLSVTWLQRFGLDRPVHLPLAAEAFRQSIPSQRLSAKSAFAIGKVSSILERGRQHGSKLRVVQDPIDGNAGHAEIRRYPRELGLLQEALANEVFSERHLYASISGSLKLRP
ncbi:MAG: hypothetical protein WBR13_07345 [Allosphingosinicella sp.]